MSAVVSAVAAFARPCLSRNEASRASRCAGNCSRSRPMVVLAMEMRRCRVPSRRSTSLWVTKESTAGTNASNRRVSKSVRPAAVDGALLLVLCSDVCAIKAFPRNTARRANAGSGGDSTTKPVSGLTVDIGDSALANTLSL